MLTDRSCCQNEELIWQEYCNDIIEKELDLFFELRFQILLSIEHGYTTGKAKSPEDLMAELNISHGELELLIKKIEHRISMKLPYKILKTADLAETGLVENLKDLRRTEKISGLSEGIINQFLSMALETVFSHILVNYYYQSLSLAENLLHYYSFEKQKKKHGSLIIRQLRGFLMNLRTDLRKELVGSALMNYSRLEEYEEDIVA